MKKYLIVANGILFFGMLIVIGGTQLSVFAHSEKDALMEIEPAANETHHLEVKPESFEGYRIPYMKVTVAIIDQITQEKQSIELHPMFGGNFHYAANVALKPQQYLLQFHLDPPMFAKGDARENQWLTPVEAEFTFDAAATFEKSVKIGSKETADMKISFEAEHAESMFILAGAEEERAAQGHMASSKGEEEESTFSHQFQELLPFEHLEEGHYITVAILLLMWGAAVYTFYSLVSKLRKTK